VNWIKSHWAIVLAALVALGAVGTGYIMRSTLYSRVWQPLIFKLDSLINYIHSGVADGE
jgi:hypothetical protein